MPAGAEKNSHLTDNHLRNLIIHWARIPYWVSSVEQDLILSKTVHEPTQGLCTLNGLLVAITDIFDRISTANYQSKMKRQIHQYDVKWIDSCQQIIFV